MEHWHRRVTVRAAGTNAVLPDQGVEDRAPHRDGALALVRRYASQLMTSLVYDDATRITAVQQENGLLVTWVDGSSKGHSRVIEAVRCEQTHTVAVPHVA